LYSAQLEKTSRALAAK